jgi:bifunctional non-homologous end joining protein LigD
VARKDQGPLPQARRISIPGAKRAKHPGFVKPQLATLRATAPADDKYVHEIKFDSYRIQAHLRGGLATIYTRSGLNWTKRFPTVAHAMGHLPATEIILDGEVVSPEENGRANFSQLQDDLSKPRYDRMVFYVFDLLYLDGFDLRACPLIERKEALAHFLSAAKNIAPIHFSEHFETDGASLFKQACDLGLEGIISKYKNAPYKSERNESWLKIKCSQSARYEVIGYSYTHTHTCPITTQAAAKASQPIAPRGIPRYVATTQPKYGNGPNFSGVERGVNNDLIIVDYVK